MNGSYTAAVIKRNYESCYQSINDEAERIVSSMTMTLYNNPESYTSCYAYDSKLFSNNTKFNDALMRKIALKMRMLGYKVFTIRVNDNLVVHASLPGVPIKPQHEYHQFMTEMCFWYLMLIAIPVFTLGLIYLF